MEIVFNRGPWDGARFDVAYAPDKIAMHDLQVAMDFSEGDFSTSIDTSIRDHCYIKGTPRLRDGVSLEEVIHREPEEGQSALELVDDEFLSFEYEFKRDGKTWWENCNPDSVFLRGDCTCQNDALPVGSRLN